LAPERTQLAWQRYCLALAVVAALALRAGLAHRHSQLGFAVAAVIAALAAITQLRALRVPGDAAVRLALGTTLAAAAGALALALA
jgi:uncharacterized membrane protein YidH (DUF202 family)